MTNTAKRSSCKGRITGKNWAQFSLKQLFGLTSIAAAVSGIVIFTLTYPILAKGVGGAVVMLLLGGIGFANSLWLAAAYVNRTSNASLANAAASGAAGWFSGTVIFFAVLSGYELIIQTFLPDPVRDEFGGPFELLIIGGVCYGLPSMLLGACIGAMLWVRKQCRPCR